MDAAVIVDFVKNVGVPAGIAVFVLWRLNGTLGALRGAIVALTLELVRHADVEAGQATTIREALRRIEERRGRMDP